MRDHVPAGHDGSALIYNVVGWRARQPLRPWAQHQWHSDGVRLPRQAATVWGVLGWQVDAWLAPL